MEKVIKYFFILLIGMSVIVGIAGVFMLPWFVTLPAIVGWFVAVPKMYYRQKCKLDMTVREELR